MKNLSTYCAVVGCLSACSQAVSDFLVHQAAFWPWAAAAWAFNFGLLNWCFRKIEIEAKATLFISDLYFRSLSDKQLRELAKACGITHDKPEVQS